MLCLLTSKSPEKEEKTRVAVKRETERQREREHTHFRLESCRGVMGKENERDEEEKDGSWIGVEEVHGACCSVFPPDLQQVMLMVFETCERRVFLCVLSRYKKAGLQFNK